MSRNSRRAVAMVAGVFAAAPLVSACAVGDHPQSAMPTQLAEGVNATANGIDVRNVFLLGPVPGQRLSAGSSAPLYAWFINKATTPDRLVAVETSGVAQAAQIAGGALVLPPGRLVATAQPPGAQTVPSATPTAAKSPTKPPKPPKSPKPPQSPNPPRSPKPPAGRTPKPGTSATTTGAPQGGGAVQGGESASPQAAMPEPSSVILKGLTKDFLGGETVRLVLHFQQAGAITLNVPITPRDSYYSTYSPVPVPPVPSATPLPAQSAAGNGTPKVRKPKKASATPSA